MPSRNSTRKVPSRADGGSFPAVILPLGSRMFTSITSWDVIGTAVLLVMAILWKIVFFQRMGRRKYPNESVVCKTSSVFSSHTFSADLKRKQDFLARHEQDYGYRDSPMGFIDQWRPVEFPSLHQPLGYLRRGRDEEEREVYLDYAGSALPMKSQLERIAQDNGSTVLANPHSTGPAASRTLHKIQQVKALILKHFDALPGRYASLKLPDSFYNSDRRANNRQSDMDCHAGYNVVFTSGATEGCRIVAERFPWQSAASSLRPSIFLYVTNSHNSVVGMRQLALSRGAIFHCIDMPTLESMTVDDFRILEQRLVQEARGQQDTSVKAYANKSIIQRRHLLVFPAECNFGGHRPESASILAVAKRSGWYTMLDIAKAASTGPVNLRELDPDFAVMSFYKLFGDPTGLGALLVKRSSISVLFEKDTMRHYQGGGSVDIMMPKQDYVVPKQESAAACLDSLTNGTIHFRGIVNLLHGFETLEQLGGMSKIQEHTSCLAKELAQWLRNLKHGNGTAAIRLYGGWERVNGDSDNLERAFVGGPTITFNVIRSDGSIVGYNEVSKLASLHHPPIQFRTGCFCNPGACQQALALSEKEVIDNFEKAGHVCGDHLDLVNGQPTGAIRISFGKESLWEDMDAVVQFLHSTFVDDKWDGGHEEVEGSSILHSIGRSETTAGTTAQVSSMFIFPIKSCSAQQVQRWQIEMPSGKLRYDREFALVDTSGAALRLQTCPRLGLISPKIDLNPDTMTVSAPGCSDLVINLHEDLYHGGENAVRVCGNKCGGRLWGDAFVSEWFSAFLGIECWLARYSESESNMMADGKKATSIRTGFSNEQPILLVSDHAVGVLNSVLIDQGYDPVDAKRFRPNIVVKTHEDLDQKGQPSHCYRDQHIEDNWKVLSLANKGFSFKVEGPCPRCTMVDYDPVTGKKGRTLRALAKYRRRNGSIVFGIFLKANKTSLNDPQTTIWIEQGDLLNCT